MNSFVVTFTTDFGYTDSYSAAMKGVVLGINPSATLVDISHDVEPQAVINAAFVLAAAAPFFPAGTVHVGVVDPGVGTNRRAIAVQADQQCFVLPDNGLLTFLLRNATGASHSAQQIDEAPLLEPFMAPVPDDWTAVHLTNERYWHHPVSPTFHGRDIFSPVAGHLSMGIDLKELGPPVDALVCLNVPSPRWKGDTLEGQVIQVDHFGNLVSTIPNNALPPETTDIRVEIMGVAISGLSRNFQASGRLLALKGSAGFLEVALAGGSASKELRCDVGTGVRISVVGGG